MAATVSTRQREGDDYTEQEAQQRFERLVRVALNTRPKPIKSMGPKGVRAQSKKQQKRRRKVA
jgi:hypothetical protein